MPYNTQVSTGGPDYSAPVAMPDTTPSMSDVATKISSSRPSSQPTTVIGTDGKTYTKSSIGLTDVATGKTRYNAESNPIYDPNNPVYDDAQQYFAGISAGSDGTNGQSINAMMQNYLTSHGMALNQNSFDALATRMGFQRDPNGGAGYWNPAGGQQGLPIGNIGSPSGGGTYEGLPGGVARPTSGTGGGGTGAPGGGIRGTGGQGGMPSGGFNPATDTTRGQLESMLAQDSEYMQAAKTGALQQANERGLLNSSIAASAGQRAAIDAAGVIADATANQYQKSKLTTQELNSRMDLANLDANTRMRIAELGKESDDAKIASAEKQSALGNYRSIAESTNGMIQSILVSPTLTPEAKQQAINNVLMRHDEYISFQDEIMGYDLGSLITYEGV